MKTKSHVMTLDGRVLALALVLAGAGAQAQSNGIPGPQDYASFSRFITDRNIFDPNRQPHSYGTGYKPKPSRHRTGNDTPSVTLVGTMAYGSGVYAFFNGNNYDVSNAMLVGGKIAECTVTKIAEDGVELASADGKQKYTLAIGDGLRQEGGKWAPVQSGDLGNYGGGGNAADASSSGSSGGSDTSAAPPSSGEANDVLKRLMQLREKENQ